MFAVFWYDPGAPSGFLDLDRLDCSVQVLANGLPFVNEAACSFGPADVDWRTNPSTPVAPMGTFTTWSDTQIEWSLPSFTISGLTFSNVVFRAQDPSAHYVHPSTAYRP
jgi:hypothetical protein